MDVLGGLSSSRNRRDQGPNRALAARLAKSGTADDIDTLFGIIRTGKRAARFDAIVVAYEVAERNPRLILPHADELFELLTSKDNRILWGAICGLYHLRALIAEQLMAHLDAILAAADRGSVIAKDRTTAILAHLNSDPRFAPVVTPVLLQRLAHAAVNQLPMYAEMTVATLPEAHYPAFRSVVEKRLKTLSYPAKRKRLEKVLKSLR